LAGSRTYHRNISIAALIAIAIGVLTAITVGSPKTLKLEQGLLLPKPRPLPEFQLIDSHRQAFGNAQLTGQWSLLFAGFTNCPDVCPNTLALLKAVHRQLDEQKLPLHVVFISVDPERDTPERLDEYTRYFSPDFTGVTGPLAQLDRLAASAGLVYAKVPGANPDSYTMDHSAALVLIDPQARIAAYFTPPFKIEALASDLAKVLKSAS